MMRQNNRLVFDANWSAVLSGLHIHLERLHHLHSVLLKHHKISQVIANPRTFRWSRPNWQISARSKKMSSQHSVTYDMASVRIDMWIHVNTRDTCFSNLWTVFVCLLPLGNLQEWHETSGSQQRSSGIPFALKHISFFDMNIFRFWGDPVLLPSSISYVNFCPYNSIHACESSLQEYLYRMERAIDASRHVSTCLGVQVSVHCMRG